MNTELINAAKLAKIILENNTQYLRNRELIKKLFHTTTESVYKVKERLIMIVDTITPMT